jgi:hypothetical protein
MDIYGYNRMDIYGYNRMDIKKEGRGYGGEP